ncbi:MAG: LytTR family DNA-binding domain-containing protein [Cyclobacteriaceae bacterium]
MTDLFRNKGKASLIVAIYSAIILFVFDPFTFAEIDLKWLAILVAVLLLGTLSYVQLWISEGYERKLRLIIRSFSDLIVSLVAGMLVWSIFAENQDYLIVYSSAFLVLPLPIIAFRVLLFFSNQLNEKIKVSTISETTEVEKETKLQLANDAGKVLLSVAPSKIICFEANDNYVVTYYLSGEGELKKSMERISLKKIEEILEDLDTSFYRVHKSYIVNPYFVEKISGRSQAYKLNISYIDSPIPVSRKFDISVFNR